MSLLFFAVLSTGGGWRNRNSVDLAVRFVFYQLLRVVDYIHCESMIYHA